jgi:hypothetical protein
MIALVTLALLAAAPPKPILEPDAGGLKRLQPRLLSASSFLLTGYNKFEENYLPQYIADDDPTTAWVEGVKGTGEGESLLWMGPPLKKAKSFRVFVRNGYQKSKNLYGANARPKKLRLEPVKGGEVAPVGAGKPVELELADVQGWQQVEVPVQAEVSGLRLTVLSVYPGATYEDTCISDLRVYVDGEDPYKADAEASAAEQIRRFAADRKAASKAGNARSRIALAPAYVGEIIYDGDAPAADPWKPLAKKAGFAELVTAATFAVQSLDAADPKDAKTFTQVKHSSRSKVAAANRVALSALRQADYDLPNLIQLFDRSEVTVFEDSGAARKKLEGLKKGGNCMALCKAVRAEFPTEVGGCSCELECGLGAEGDECFGTNSGQLLSKLEGTGAWVKGTLAKPEALLLSTYSETGERETVIDDRKTLVAWDGDLVRSIASHRGGWDYEREKDDYTVHVFDWKNAADKPELAAVTTFQVTPDGDGKKVMLTVWRWTPKPAKA